MEVDGMQWERDVISVNKVTIIVLLHLGKALYSE